MSLLKQDFSRGAGNGDRTRDPQLGRLMLCQLSYSRLSVKTIRWIRLFRNPNSYQNLSSSNPFRLLLTAIFRRHVLDERAFDYFSEYPLAGLVERGGFEPPKASPTDLQSVPFGRSGTSPNQN